MVVCCCIARGLEIPPRLPTRSQEHRVSFLRWQEQVAPFSGLLPVAALLCPRDRSGSCVGQPASIPQRKGEGDAARRCPHSRWWGRGVLASGMLGIATAPPGRVSRRCGCWGGAVLSCAHPDQRSTLRAYSGPAPPPQPHRRTPRTDRTQTTFPANDGSTWLWRPSGRTGRPRRPDFLDCATTEGAFVCIRRVEQGVFEEGGSLTPSRPG